MGNKINKEGKCIRSDEETSTSVQDLDANGMFTFYSSSKLEELLDEQYSEFPDYFKQVPQEILHYIMCFMDSSDLLPFSLVCKRFNYLLDVRISLI